MGNHTISNQWDAMAAVDDEVDVSNYSQISEDPDSTDFDFADVMSTSQLQRNAKDDGFIGNGLSSPSQSRSSPFEIDEFIGTDSDDTGMTARVLLMLNPSCCSTSDLQ